MLIHIYEHVINEDGSRSPGRLVAEIKCKGDGSPEDIVYFDMCNEAWEIKDMKHLLYGQEIPILDDFQKKWIGELFNKSSFVSTKSGMDTKGIHSIEGTTLGSWTREAIENVLDFELASLIGTICGKIIED